MENDIIKLSAQLDLLEGLPFKNGKICVGEHDIELIAYVDYKDIERTLYNIKSKLIGLGINIEERKKLVG